MNSGNFLTPLKIGESYDRPKLASLWGLKGYQAISRGVFTPAKTNLIFLFITRVKQSCLTQYQDFLFGNILQWEGEKQHTSDQRIINASANEEDIYLFYREVHHTPFVYQGKIVLIRFVPHKDRPSEFIFDVEAHVTPIVESDPNVLSVHEDPVDYAAISDVVLNKIDCQILKKDRGLAQMIFRSNQLKFWNGACAVTGVRDQRVLRASHIKPWKESTLTEKVDRSNGLLLIPDLDALFDKGLITFLPTGTMRVSSSFKPDDQQKMRIDHSFQLRKVTDDMQPFLDYHREHCFVS